MKFKSPFLIKPHTKVRLKKIASGATPGVADEAASKAVLDAHRKQLADLQEVFYAAQSKALLIVLQGMDTVGKDGTISHIFSGVNPQGCDVASFKVPTSLEARHDFLWRCHQQSAAARMIGIFNRSHYEDVLSPRVHKKIDAATARARMDEINDFEKTLAANGVLVLKFFLHISHAEQTARLQARIDDKHKHWKLSPADFEERVFWDGYQAAYEDILSHTSHKHAPWFVIPADHKWYRNFAISAVLVEVLKSLDLKFPPPTFDPSGIKLDESSPQKAARKVAKRVNDDGVDPEKDSLVTGKKN